MHYRNLADLDVVCRDLALRARGADLVVGVPRSGMLAASAIALHANLPLADLDGYLAGRVLGSGERPLRSGGGGRVLLVDDSVLTGAAMRAAAERCRAHSRAAQDELLTAAAYVSREGRGAVDLFGEVVDAPRVFAWNVLHHPALRSACLDIDGLLCDDPSDEDNDDGERYARFLRTAAPRHLPTVAVGHVVTSRLERYRGLTERWLSEHDVRYGRLHMLDLPTAAARRAAGAHALHKADVYSRTRAWLFLESDLRQAREIAVLSGRPVFATDVWTLVYPHGEHPTGTSSRPTTADALPLFLRSRARVTRQRLRSVVPRPR